MIISHSALRTTPLQIRSSGFSQAARRLLLRLHSEGRQSFKGTAIDTHTWNHAAESATHGTLYVPSLTSCNQPLNHSSIHSLIHSFISSFMYDYYCHFTICSSLKLWNPLVLLSHLPSTPVCCPRPLATLQVLLHHNMKYQGRNITSACVVSFIFVLLLYSMDC